MDGWREGGREGGRKIGTHWEGREGGRTRVMVGFLVMAVLAVSCFPTVSRLVTRIRYDTGYVTGGLRAHALGG